MSLSHCVPIVRNAAARQNESRSVRWHNCDLPYFARITSVGTSIGSHSNDSVTEFNTRAVVSAADGGLGATAPSRARLESPLRKHGAVVCSVMSETVMSDGREECDDNIVSSGPPIVEAIVNRQFIPRD